MVQMLTEMIGLPTDAGLNEIAQAADRQSETLFAKSADGDATACRQLVELQVAYLVWAYAKREIRGAAVGGTLHHRN